MDHRQIEVECADGTVSDLIMYVFLNTWTVITVSAKTLKKYIVFILIL